MKSPTKLLELHKYEGVSVDMLHIAPPLCLEVSSSYRDKLIAVICYQIDNPKRIKKGCIQGAILFSFK